MKTYTIEINEEDLEWLFSGLEVLFLSAPTTQILIDHINKGIRLDNN